MGDGSDAGDLCFDLGCLVVTTLRRKSSLLQAQPAMVPEEYQRALFEMTVPEEVDFSER